MCKAPITFLIAASARARADLHPTQKPVRLMQALIELTTKPDQIVLDPFAGSGSTLVAARSLRRKFIGYEMEPKYAEVCRSRLDESGLLPFMK